MSKSQIAEQVQQILRKAQHRNNTELGTYEFFLREEIAAALLKAGQNDNGLSVKLDAETWAELHLLTGDAWFDEGHRELVIDTMVNYALPESDKYDYDQVVIIARKVGPGGGMGTTYGVDKANCDVAARMGDFLKYKVMNWTRGDAK